jgi:drug/metabolite transporter (DMT)-like permease
MSVKDQGRRLRADLALALVTCFWGVTFVTVKSAVSNVSVFLFLALRFVLAAAILGALHFRALPQLRRSDLLAGARLGLFMFLGYAFQTSGLVYTTPAKSAFLTGSCVVFVPVLLALFWRGRLGLWTCASSAVALAGLFLLTVPGGPAWTLQPGDLLTLIGAVLFAVHIILAGKYTSAHPLVALSFLQCATTALLAVAFCGLGAASGWQPLRFVPGWASYSGVVITAVFATAAGFTIQLWAQRYTPPSHAAVLFTLEPVFAAITSYVVMGERLGRRSLVGAALIGAAILVAELKGPGPAAAESPQPVTSRESST